MIYLFFTPDIVPSTSTTRRFYHVDCIKNKIFSKYTSSSIFQNNNYWGNCFSQVLRNQKFSNNKILNSINISNNIFNYVINDAKFHNINNYTFVTYLWNRLAYYSGFPEESIDRVLIRKHLGFKPKIAQSKIYNKNVKTLIISSKYIPYEEVEYSYDPYDDKSSLYTSYENIDIFLKYIQILFLYHTDIKNRDKYGRLLKEKYNTGKIQKCDIDYIAKSFEYDPDEQYVLPTMNCLDPFIKSFNSRISKREINKIKSLNQKQLVKVYSMIIETLHKE